MMKKWQQKSIVCFIVGMQVFGLLPWSTIQGYAEETTTQESAGTSEILTSGEKVTVDDLDKETQKKIKESEVAPTEKNTETENGEEALTIEPDLMKIFGEKQPDMMASLKEEMLGKGLEEQLAERTENTKTFVAPETGIGETIVFTEAIHYQNEQKKWQEFSGTFEEADGKFVAEDNISVNVPKTITTETSPTVQLTSGEVGIGINEEKYELKEVNEASLLLASETEKEPLEITYQPTGAKFVQYITDETDISSLKFSLKLPENLKAKEDETKGIVGIYEAEELVGAIPMPVIETSEGDFVSSLETKFDENSKTISIRALDNEKIRTLKSARVTVQLVEVKIEQGIEATSIRQYDDKMSYWFQDYMYIGYDDGFNGTLGAAHFVTYGLLKVPNSELKKIGKDREIESASLSLFRIGAPGFWGDRAKDGNGDIVNRLFEVHGLTKDVGSLANVTYKSFSDAKFPYGPPANEDGRETRIGGINPNSRRVNFDITALANDWINGASNFGMIVKTNKVTSHELPYSTAEVFAAPKSGVNSTSPYLTIKHRERPPIDKNMPLKDTTLKLRPFVSADNDGLVQFRALGMDGIGRPDAKINYRVIDSSESNKVNFSGTDPSIGRDYLFPNYPKLFPDAQQYLELSSNWQTNTLLSGALKENHLYKVEATVNFGSEEVKKNYDSFQLYKVTSQDTLPRLLKFYGLEKNRATFMRDNNMKDELLTQGNIVFIRNPKKNQGKAYQSQPLSKADKIRLDALSVGRGKHCQYGFEPINIGSGNLIYEMTDGTWYDFEEEQLFARTYNSKGDGMDSPIGRNWTLNQYLTLNQLEDKTMMLTKEDGGKVFFDRSKDGSYKVSDDSPYTLIKKVKDEKRFFELANKEQKAIYTFDATGQIKKIVNAYGQTKEYSYEEESGFLKTIKQFNGSTVSFAWDDNGHIKKVTYPDKTTSNYEYDGQGNLLKVTDSEGKKISYTYDSNHFMTSYSDNEGNKLYQNKFDKEGRVIEQTDAEGNTVSITYEKNKTTTIDANGNKEITSYNDHFQPVKIEYADGKSETRKYNDQFQLIEEIDRAGNSTQYENDANGNVVKKTYSDGTVETSQFNDSNQVTKEIDRAGNQTSYQYNSQGKMTQITQPDGKVIIQAYDQLGQLISKTSADGVTETYTYKGGNLATISDKDGLKTGYEYNSKGLVTKELDSAGNAKQFKQNSRGELIEETDFNGNKKIYAYSSEGALLSETDFNGNKTSYSYDKLGRKIAEINSLGGKKTFVYDGNGNIVKETDFLGNAKTFTYNQLNQVIEEHSANDKVTKYTYDAIGNRLTEVVNDKSKTVFEYNLNQQVVKKIDPLKQTTIYDYNKNGQIIKETYDDKTTVAYKYDTMGNLLSKVDRNGLETLYTYNEKRQVLTTAVGDRVATNTYDIRGNRKQEMNPENHETSYGFNTLGYVSEQKDAAGNVTTYETDNQGNVTKMTDPNGHSSLFTYDGEGNVLTETDSLGNKTVFTYNGLNLLSTKVLPSEDILQYHYDSNGNLTEEIDALGNKTTYQYTVENQLEASTNPLGSEAKLSYDKFGNVKTFEDAIGRKSLYSYDLLGQMIEEKTPTGVVFKYIYDVFGQRVKQSDSHGNSETYTYDNNGQMLTATDQEKRTVTYEYNQYGEKTSETDAAGNKTTFVYDKLGNQTKIAHPQETIQTLSYDTLGRVTEEVLPNGGKYSYSYDKLGNLLTEKNPLGGVLNYAYDKNSQLVQSTSAKNEKTTFKYDKNGRLIETVDPLGNAQKVKYDANGNVQVETDATGNQTHYAYNSVNQLIQVVNANKFEQKYTYDLVGRMISETDFNGNKTSYEYDANDQVTKQEQPNHRVTTYQYDQRGNLTKITDPKKAETKMTYTKDNLLASEENAKGYKRSYQYDQFHNPTSVKDNMRKEPLETYQYNKYQQKISATDAKGRKTEYSYNNLGQLTQLVYPNKTSVSYQYDVLNRVSEITDIRGNKTKTEYDANGQVTQFIAPGDQRYAYEYDSNGNVTKEQDPLAFTSMYTYNQLNNVAEETNAVGHKKIYEYDKLQQVSAIIDGRKNKTQLAYDGNGQVVKEIDAKGKEKNYSYDSNNQLTSVKNRLGKITSYTYDEQSNLTSIKDALGNQTSLSYSQTGELESILSANGKKESYEYTLDGQLSKKTTAKEESIQYKYDEMNQLIGKVTKNVNFTYAYTEDNNMSSASFEETEPTTAIENKALKEKNPTQGNIAFQYNKFGDMTKATDESGNSLSYEYDQLGRKISVIYPSQRKISYQYDKKNQLTTVKEGEEETLYEHDGLGNITKISYPNGSISRYTHTETGEIATAETLEANGQALSKLTYEYDENENLQKEVIQYPKLKLERNYEYDAEDQLVKVVEDEGKKTTEIGYIYDDAGNRIAYSEQVNGKKKQYKEYKTNEVNQLTEITSEKGATFEYDGNGNVSKKISMTGEVVTYLYDAEDRLVQETSNHGIYTFYSYDALGNRTIKVTAVEHNRKIKTDMLAWVKQTDRTSQLSLKQQDITLLEALTAVVNNPGLAASLRCLPKDRPWRIDRETPRKTVKTEKLKKELDCQHSIKVVTALNDYNQEYVTPAKLVQETYNKKIKTTQTQEFTFDDNGTVIGDQEDNYHQDGYGSVGTIIEKQSSEFVTNTLYNEFGESVLQVENEFGYRSEFHDTSSRIHLRAREYTAEIGRFLQEDSYMGEIKRPQSLNRYSYVENNPQKYIDPTGHAAKKKKSPLNNILGALGNLWNAFKPFIPRPFINAINTIGNVVRPLYNSVVRQVTNYGFPPRVYRPFVQAGQALYNVGRAVSNVSYINSPSYRLAVKKQAAQATRKRAQLRIKKLCETADKKWQGDKLVSLYAIPIPIVPPIVSPTPGAGKTSFFPDDFALPKLPSIKDVIRDAQNKVLGWVIGKVIQSATTADEYDKTAKENDWGNSSTLEDHYDRHKDETGAKNVDDYAKKARKLYNNRGNHQVKTEKDGTTRVFDEETGLFGSYNPDGTTKTIFKPDRGQDYFDQQPGR